MQTPAPAIRLLAFAFLLFSSPLFSQTADKWFTNGNAVVSGDFLGTTNNASLNFRTNNVQRMSLGANGTLQLNALAGTGTGFAWFDANGNLMRSNFNNDSTRVLTGKGTFSPIDGLSGWRISGTTLSNVNSGNIGIGVSNPAYKLDVNGSAYFTGTVYAHGLSLLDNLEADTIKGFSSIEVNHTMIFNCNGINSFYVNDGDLRIQSQTGFNGNTLLNAATSGNVGIGTNTPLYKLDVGGDARFLSKVYLHRILPLPGDSEIHFGDSSIVLNPNSGRISNNSGSHGLGIGSSSFCTGLNSVAIGNHAISSGAGTIAIGNRVNSGALAANAITIGSGVANGPNLLNTVPSSLAIGFNSTIPTFFVAAANGAGTIGKVGIGTTNPLAEMQFNEGTRRINIDAGQPTNTYGLLGYLGFNAEINSGAYMHATGDGTTNTGGMISLAADGSLRFNVLPNTGGADQLQDAAHFHANSQLRIYNSRIEIGAGTLLPSSPYYTDALTRLTVDGRIMCKDVVVSLIDWQDEVFDSAYVLLPMDSVQDFIRASHHLPGVPAEGEIESQGMSVARTAEIQQAKIEEMMLYILQLNERMKALEAENAKLKTDGGN